MAVTTCHVVNIYSNFHRICRLSRFFRTARRLKDSSELFYSFIFSFKQSNLYEIRISYPAVIGYTYSSFRNIGIFTLKIPRGILSCDLILGAYPKSHFVLNHQEFSGLFS
ncbi:hypothetical protein MSBR2_1380 [Methanosarcina barkeri 227]|uniref:Uncharacterized protein n=1 Tax=Methanosarcina barkeri 227 TaxID=1434106 RepID=A0A0E3LQ98_METBA|nr:hypothetical protein MSBR2_1380 [Methanosarcina barkeri 227]